jgi:hypothetical protein
VKPFLTGICILIVWLFTPATKVVRGHRLRRTFFELVELA